MSARSRRWIREHRADPYVKRARDRGYRSRAAFKLIEIDDDARLLGRGAAVVDLGAAPGGWSQVAAERVAPGGVVVAVDRLEIVPIPGVTVIVGDLVDEDVREHVREAAGEAGCSVLLSDMAPDLSGVAATDEARTEALAEVVVEIADRVLASGGALVAKTFAGAPGEWLRGELGRRFDRVAVRKPGASRSRSSEYYLLAQGYRRAKG